MTAAQFVHETSTVEGKSIAMWHGSLSDIPKGWALCDGNNGTPDLRDKFIAAPSSYSNGPGSELGADTKSLSTSQMPSHDHPGGTGGGGGHSHGMKGYSGTGGTDPSIVGGTSGSDNIESGSAGSHSHSTSGTDSTGSGNSIDNRPHYYEVAFLYKI